MTARNSRASSASNTIAVTSKMGPYRDAPEGRLAHVETQVTGHLGTSGDLPRVAAAWLSSAPEVWQGQCRDDEDQAIVGASRISLAMVVTTPKHVVLTRLPKARLDHGQVQGSKCAVDVGERRLAVGLQRLAGSALPVRSAWPSRSG